MPISHLPRRRRWTAATAAAAVLSTGVLAVLAGCAAPSTAPAPVASDLVRYKIPGSDFPISAAVEIPAGASVVYLSGQVPPVVDKTKPATSPAAYGGDTEGQTVAVLKAIEAQLKSMGLEMQDVVKMQVFLTGDPAKGGKMDFAGFMKGYTQFFGPAAGQPNLPARSAFQVAALANPAYRIEIEVAAVRGGRTVIR